MQKHLRKTCTGTWLTGPDQALVQRLWKRVRKTCTELLRNKLKCYLKSFKKEVWLSSNTTPAELTFFFLPEFLQLVLDASERLLHGGVLPGQDLHQAVHECDGSLGAVVPDDDAGHVAPRPPLLQPLRDLLQVKQKFLELDARQLVQDGAQRRPPLRLQSLQVHLSTNRKWWEVTVC